MFQRLARRALFAPETRHPLALASPLSRARTCAAAIVLAGLGLAGCAQQPQQLAAAGHGREYFPSSVYGRASRRVIADGQPVPRGGGQYLVGKPYTIAGQTYYPSERRITQIGLASWYGDAFHGRLTANGEIYDRDSFTAAHPTMPLPSYARVTNLRNNTSMIVRVNDRGPYHSNRIMDVSRRVADALDIRRTGTAKVKVEWVGRASLAGSDDAKLAATLRMDGPARLDGVEQPVMVAAAAAPARVASLGAYYPTPTRRLPVAEGQRSENLESYQAPRAASEAPPRHDREVEEAEEAPRRERHRLTPEPAARPALGDDEPSTGSMPRHRYAGGIKDGAGRQEEALSFAKHGPTNKARDVHVARSDEPAPALRHATLSPQDRLPQRLLPPARPARLAAVLPPARPRGVGLRMARSHDD